MNVLPLFPNKWFQFLQWKICKKKQQNMLFSSAHNTRFWGQGTFKTIFWEASYDQILIEKVLNVLPHFSRKWFQLCHSKICKKLNSALFKRLQHSFLISRKLQIHFLRSFLWPNVDLNSFECFFLTFSKNDFNFVNEKFIKKWEMPFLNAQNILFWAQGSFKTSF